MAKNQLNCYIYPMNDIVFYIQEWNTAATVKTDEETFLIDLLVGISVNRNIVFAGQVNQIPILGMGEYGNGMLHLETVEPDGLMEVDGATVMLMDYKPTHYQDVDLLNLLINKIYEVPEFQRYAQLWDEEDADMTTFFYHHDTQARELIPNFVRKEIECQPENN